ncbi:MAG: SPASM domain-containing protein, partial [Pelodictyon phaeoclathratiforme]
MNVDEYLRLLNDFKDSGGQFLGIPGNGEPFHPSNRDLVMRILRHANSLGLRTTVFTTGETLFWEMRSNRTYAKNVGAEPDFAIMEELIGLDVILLIKCNSLKHDVQDDLVAQPGYTDARTMAMQWLMEKYSLNSDKENRRLGIVTSIMPENQDEIVDLYRYAETNNLIFDCDTILPQGRGQSFIKPGHSLSDQECRAIYQTLDSISEEHLSTGGSYVGVACDRIKHHLYIDICGNAYTCIGCVGRGQDLVLGNIRKQSLVDIWNNTIRVQMRDNLDKIVLGTCSYCENFQVSCWTCLGRSVERFEFKDGKIILHTRGCFNHRPDWNRWLLQCDRLTRTRLSEVPAAIRSQVRARIH